MRRKAEARSAASDPMNPVRHPGEHRRSGFTLLELLVSIAIMLILAASVFSFSSTAFSNARRMECISRLRACHPAFLSYAGDNDGRLPVASTITDNWIMRTYVYLDIKSFSISVNHGKSPYFCPEALRSQKPYGSIGDTYGMNSFLSEMKLAQISRPASVFLLTDGAKIGTQFWLDINPTTKIPSKIHGGKANCLFVDGHVEALSSWPTDVSNPPWRPGS